MKFMDREHDGQVCTPKSFKTKKLDYDCEEGGTLAVACHLMFFNDQFENVGIFRFWPQENYVSFCNSVIAMGTADKARNELLVVYQYFNTHAKAAGSVSELGSGWKRMTSLVRLQLDSGKITAVEDDSCLKNPNTIDTIPDARAALKQCAHEKK